MARARTIVDTSPKMGKSDPTIVKPSSVFVNRFRSYMHTTVKTAGTILEKVEKAGNRI